MPLEHHKLACDVLVAGGGMSGVCAALSAAQHGAKVILVQEQLSKNRIIVERDATKGTVQASCTS